MNMELAQRNNDEQAAEKLLSHETTKLQELHEVFGSTMERAGFSKLFEVPISSKIDPTVRFIGSHISVMKPLLEDSELIADGVFAVQDCLRTRNIRSYLEASTVMEYGSMFTSLGALVRPGDYRKLLAATSGFISESLSRQTDQVYFKLKSDFIDMNSAVLEAFPTSHVIYDDEDESFYEHKIGHEKIAGRSFNFGIVDENGNEGDIGNIIFLEDDERVIAIELAIGDTTTQKQLQNYPHVLSAYGLDGLQLTSDYSEADKISMHDSLIVVSRLVKEGLEPSSSTNQNRLFRSYLKNVYLIMNKYQNSINDIQRAILQLERTVGILQTNNSTTATNIVGYFVHDYSLHLQSSKPLSKEDKLVLRRINGTSDND